MLTQLRRARFARYVVVPALLVLVSGCHKWTRIELGPQMPDRVRVSTTPTPTGAACPENHRTFEVDSPRVVADSLHHLMSHSRPIPMSNICNLEKRVVDPVAAGFSVVGALAGLAGLGIIALVIADPFGGPCTSPFGPC